MLDHTVGFAFSAEPISDLGSIIKGHAESARTPVTWTAIVANRRLS